MTANAIGSGKLAGLVAAQNHDHVGHTAAGAPQGDLHPFALGEDAEADLSRLVGQRTISTGVGPWRPFQA